MILPVSVCSFHQLGLEMGLLLSSFYGIEKEDILFQGLIGRSSECCCRVFVLWSAVELYVVKARAQSSWEDAMTVFEGV
jgi:hypothetical protein